MITAEANGTPRWARRFSKVASIDMAVDPSGRAAVAGTATGFCSNLMGFFFNLAGDSLWGGALITQGSGCVLGPVSIATAPDHHVLIGGRFAGSLSFGNKPTITDQPDNGFLLDLNP